MPSSVQILRALLPHPACGLLADSVGGVDAVIEVLDRTADLSGVPAERVDSFCRGFVAFAHAVVEANLPTIYGRAFTESLASFLFGYDPLLMLLAPRAPTRRILLVGERGTGKERVARVLATSLAALADPSTRAPVIAVNAAALPDTLLESTLFGHTKGAFTGAARAREGLLAQLDPGGVLFFDEAGEASPALQAKLLRVLQTGEYAPVGKPEDVHTARFHVVAATNTSLEALESGTAMRSDLFDRLAAPVIQLPPLRTLLTNAARSRTILQSVAMQVIRELGAGDAVGGEHPPPAATIRRPDDPRDIDFELWATPRAARIARALEERSRGYAWPGNLREAAQRIRQSLFVGVQEAAPSDVERTLLQTHPGTTSVSVASDAPLKSQLMQVERQLYARAAEHCATVVGLAETLGVTRQTASKRLQYFELTLGAPPSAPAAPVMAELEAPPHEGPDGWSARLANSIVEPLPTVPQLLERIAQHLVAIEGAVPHNRFIDVGLARRIATSLRALATEPTDTPSEAHMRLVSAAVGYFVETSDDDHDLTSLIGLDDDVAVLNEVARLLGRDDLCVTIR